MMDYKSYRRFCIENNYLAYSLQEFNEILGKEMLHPNEWLKLARERKSFFDPIDMDGVKRFCADKVDPGADYRIEINQLYRAYADYCAKNSLKAGSKRYFGRNATPDIAGFVFNSNGQRYRRARLKIKDVQCQDCDQIHDPGAKKCKACGSKNMKECEN